MRYSVELDDLSRAGEYLRDARTSLRYTVHYYTVVGSTQDVAKRMAEEGAPEGVVILSEEMTSGRGRLGRKWHAARGGLWMTLLLRPPIEPSRVQLLSLAASVAVCESLNALLGLPFYIKWPNDVLYEGLKVSGVLVEASVTEGSIDYALVGVGINVNNEVAAELRGVAVSLRDIAGGPVPRLPLLKAFLESFDRLYAYLKGGDVGKVLAEWKERSRTIGSRVRVVTRGGVITGVAFDVVPDGSLLIMADDGSTLVVSEGEVVHLRH